jgi:hypothetical protein
VRAPPCRLLLALTRLRPSSRRSRHPIRRPQLAPARARAQTLGARARRSCCSSTCWRSTAPSAFTFSRRHLLLLCRTLGRGVVPQLSKLPRRAQRPAVRARGTLTDVDGGRPRATPTREPARDAAYRAHLPSEDDRPVRDGLRHARGRASVPSHLVAPSRPRVGASDASEAPNARPRQHLCFQLVGDGGSERRRRRS